MSEKIQTRRSRWVRMTEEESCCARRLLYSSYLSSLSFLEQGESRVVTSACEVSAFEERGGRVQRLCSSCLLDEIKGVVRESENIVSFDSTQTPPPPFLSFSPPKNCTACTRTILFIMAGECASTFWLSQEGEVARLKGRRVRSSSRRG